MLVYLLSLTSKSAHKFCSFLPLKHRFAFLFCTTFYHFQFLSHLSIRTLMSYTLFESWFSLSDIQYYPAKIDFSIFMPIFLFSLLFFSFFFFYCWHSEVLCLYLEAIWITLLNLSDHILPFLIFIFVFSSYAVLSYLVSYLLYHDDLMFFFFFFLLFNNFD